MGEWSYRVKEAPKGEVLWLTVEYGVGQTVLKCMIDALTPGIKVRAWKPVECWPEPAGLPPKPEQITSSELNEFRMAQIVEEASPRIRIGKTQMQKLVAAVEKRTREIVEWENRYE